MNNTDFVLWIVYIYLNGEKYKKMALKQALWYRSCRRSKSGGRLGWQAVYTSPHFCQQIWWKSVNLPEDFLTTDSHQICWQKWGRSISAGRFTNCHQICQHFLLQINSYTYAFFFLFSLYYLFVIISKSFIFLSLLLGIKSIGDIHIISYCISAYRDESFCWLIQLASG